MRDKFMSFEEATAVQQFGGATVQLDPSMLPNFMSNIPHEIIIAVYASGCSAKGDLFYDPRRGSGSAIIGYEVYRTGTDGLASIKQDIYCGVSGLEPDLITVIGPSIKDGEHWISAVPKRLQDVPYIGVSPEWDL